MHLVDSVLIKLAYLADQICLVRTERVTTSLIGEKNLQSKEGKYVDEIIFFISTRRFK